MSELCFLSITEAAALTQARKLSPVELDQAYLDRIAALDEQVNAFITLTRELALEQAQRAEQEIASGRYRGPMHGIPFRLKDLYATAGMCRRKSRQDSMTRAPFCWASSRPSNSPTAHLHSTCRGRLRAIRGTLRTAPAARRAAPPRR